MKLFQWTTLTCTEGDILVTPSTQQKVASTAKPGIKSPCSPRVAQTAPTRQVPASCLWCVYPLFLCAAKNINITQEL